MSHPALRAVEDNRHFPKTGGSTLTQVHHQHPGPIRPLMQLTPLAGGGSAIIIDDEEAPTGIIDLCEPICKHGAWFRPLVRETHALHCGLKIKFLRREPPGKVYQGGDLDGRIKTLLDALTMPQHIERVLEKTTRANDPLYCLLEDDSQVSGLEIESERLLGDQNNAKDFARLVIEVDVRVRQATIYNHSFLG
jgi:hypothetical protein